MFVLATSRAGAACASSVGSSRAVALGVSRRFFSAKNLSIGVVQRPGEGAYRTVTVLPGQG